ncbi:MAG: DNA internalization-related competence protein ComEC/Rec2 [Burkholderiaceae bacterium]|nr:DNA internalization-related competence protein ComEC/Rec2 [Burkholderiaceae bacterium]
MGRLAALGWIVGAALIHTLGNLPSSGALISAAAVLAITGILLRTGSLRTTGHTPELSGGLAMMLAFAFAGAAHTTWCAHARIADQLAPELEDKVTRLTLLVTGLPADRDGARRFEAQVLESPVAGIPQRILVSWASPRQWGGAEKPRMASDDRQLPPVLPGQVWRAALVLRRPHGTLNPAAFDYEGWMFARNVRAIAKVRGDPVLLDDRPLASAEAMVSRARYAVRAAMRQALGDRRYAAVMIALAIGDQDGVQAGDWLVFGRTGITHLVSISGSHVTMLAAMAAWCAMWIWKRVRIGSQPACEWLPARMIGAMIAVAVAWGYCLLAGWGVPARRTFLMLAVAAFGMGLRTPLAPTRIVCAAAALVIVADPWAPMATGFWLSFGAVAVLLGAGASATRMPKGTTNGTRLRDLFVAAARLQWLITLAMLPVLAFLFQQASASSPLANAIAIPAITFVVTPLALATGLLAMIPGLSGVAAALGWVGHQALWWTLVPVTWLAEVPWATLDVAQVPWPLLLLAMLGVGWALQPKGVPARWAGWCLVVPALTWQPPRPQHGEWRLVALDVGQGSAIVISTQSSDTLFDTGPAMGASDAGERILAPALRVFGIRSLASLVVSHPDLDHAGGLRSVISAIPVARTYASYDLPARLGATRGATRGARSTGEPPALPGVFQSCERGMGWQSDGVTFAFLHPERARAASERKARGSNARSCVLRIQGLHHSILLTGDIGVREEGAILATGDATADLVVVAHHGSRSSSSASFVAASRASHALIQAGRHNRFGHPDALVLQRWEDAGAEVWRSDLHGAVIATSGQNGLNVLAERQLQRRYWHGQ